MVVVVGVVAAVVVVAMVIIVGRRRCRRSSKSSSGGNTSCLRPFILLTAGIIIITMTVTSSDHQSPSSSSSSAAASYHHHHHQHHHVIISPDHDRHAKFEAFALRCNLQTGRERPCCTAGRHRALQRRNSCCLHLCRESSYSKDRSKMKKSIRHMCVSQIQDRSLAVEGRLTRNLNQKKALTSGKPDRENSEYVTRQKQETLAPELEY